MRTNLYTRHSRCYTLTCVISSKLLALRDREAKLSPNRAVDFSMLKEHTHNTDPYITHLNNANRTHPPGYRQFKMGLKCMRYHVHAENSEKNVVRIGNG